MTRARTGGWTLTELLVLVAVIGLVASIAIPMALRARRMDPEPDTAAAIRTVRAVPQDYNGSSRRPVSTPASGVAPAVRSVNLASGVRPSLP